MRARRNFAIITTLLEGGALLIIMVWGLPQVRVRIPLWGTIGLMSMWLAYSVITYRAGTRALQRRPMEGLSSMIGVKGKVVKPLKPEGLVRICGELWHASAENDEISPGEEVIVTAQDGLKLVVRTVIKSN